MFRRIKSSSLPVSLVALLSACTTSSPGPGVVAKQWTSNIDQLGINAIYPPRENVYVGDAYVSYTSIKPTKGNHTSTNTPFEPAVWLTSVRSKAPSFYANRPSFKFAKLKYESDPDGSKIWEQPPDRISLPTKTSSDRLRLVGFPAYNFISTTAASLGLNIPGGTVGGTAGVKYAKDLKISVSAPTAESYGVPALDLYQSFVNQCESYKDFDNVIGIASNDLLTPLPNNKKFKAVIILISQVFYTRSLIFSYSSKSGFGAKFTADLASLNNLTGAAASIEKNLKKLTAASGSGGTGAGGAATKQQIATFESESKSFRNQLLKDAKSAVPPVPGATASLVSATALGITLKETFGRPVAIGYRAISFTRKGKNACTFTGAGVSQNNGGMGALQKN